MQRCGKITVPLSATEPLYIAARLASRGPGEVTLTTSCAAAAPVDLSLLRITVSGDASASGVYELSPSEPSRNGLPHYVKQNTGEPLGVQVYHFFYEPPQWVMTKAPRYQEESNEYLGSVGFASNLFGVTSFTSGKTVSITPVCPTSSYSQGSGLQKTCSACGAYQFAPPGSSAANACACAPGAGMTGGVCAPCVGDTFRASIAENVPCNACPEGSFALDGAQAPAGCISAVCEQLTM